MNKMLFFPLPNKDLRSAAVPPLETILPDRFVPTVVLHKAKELAKQAMIRKDTVTISLPYYVRAYPFKYTYLDRQSFVFFLRGGEGQS